MIDTVHRNGVNTLAKVLSREDSCFLCGMYMYSKYVCMYRVRKMERMPFAPWNMLYNVYITCQRSWLRSNLIYKVIFEVLHHAKSSEALYPNYFQ